MLHEWSLREVHLEATMLERRDGCLAHAKLYTALSCKHCGACLVLKPFCLLVGELVSWVVLPETSLVRI